MEPFVPPALRDAGAAELELEERARLRAHATTQLARKAHRRTLGKAVRGDRASAARVHKVWGNRPRRGRRADG